jgi:tetraacyldisaccharide 4'-kinase
VLDDGFQHRALYRDVDLLLVDATDIQGLQALVPAGRLREPLSSATRASAVLVTRVDAIADAQPVMSMIQHETGSAVQPILIQFASRRVVNVRDGDGASIDQIVGRPAVIFSGIGNASAFRALVLRHGLRVADEVIFPDHHAYTKSDIDRLEERAKRAGASILVTTEKDAVKLQTILSLDMPIYAVRLDTQILEGRERLIKLITMSDER